MLLQLLPGGVAFYWNGSIENRKGPVSCIKVYVYNDFKASHGMARTRSGLSLLYTHCIRLLLIQM